MKNNAQQFLDCLTEAEDILEDYTFGGYSNVNPNLEYITPEHFNLALFEQWSEFCEPEVQQKPTIRVIHHLSCTGGSLIAKCLAAMPNVALLSEAHPLTLLGKAPGAKFAPSDLISLATQGGFPFIDELKGKIFRADINVISEHLNQLGKYLVIREHSHSDYLLNNYPSKTSTVKSLLKDDYPLLSILTVRHPVDSYLSMTHNNWDHYTPKTIEEYCKRYLVFIEANEDVSWFKYEDIVNNPNLEMGKICKTLKLPFCEDFQDIFDIFNVTGDSGRSSNVISKRKRREYDKNFLADAYKSSKYKELCELLNYEPTIV